MEHPDKDYSTQKLILGTHTSDDEQNYLMIAEVQARGSAGCCGGATRVPRR